MREMLLLLAGLAISVALVAFGTIYVRDTLAAQNTEETFIDTTAMALNMETTYRGMPDRFGTALLTDTFLINSGIAPAGLQFDATTLRNAFSGDITVTGAATGFHIAQDGFSDEDCFKFVVQASRDTATSAIRIAAGLGAVATTAAVAIPYTAANISTACANDNNAVQLTYGIAAAVVTP